MAIVGNLNSTLIFFIPHPDWSYKLNPNWCVNLAPKNKRERACSAAVCPVESKGARIRRDLAQQKLRSIFAVPRTRGRDENKKRSKQSRTSKNQ